MATDKQEKPPRYMHLVIQEGGSSTEAYPTLFNNATEAQAHCTSCDKASYRTKGPIRLSSALTKALLANPAAETDFVEVIQQALLADWN